MRNDIQVFDSEQFGFVRTMGTTEEPLFCLIDVCRVLELDESQVARRLDGSTVSKHPVPDNLGRMQETNFINEDGLYDVIFDSRKPEARKFRKWVTSEVLPSIRKTGKYVDSVRSTFLELDGTLPLFLDKYDIAHAIGSVDCLMALAKRQRKLLDEINKTYDWGHRMQDKADALKEQLAEKKARIKELEAIVKDLQTIYPKRSNRKKGGAS